MPTAREIPWRATPDAALAAWPDDQPLAVLHSGAGPIEHARWTLLARPSEIIRVRDAAAWERSCEFLRRTLARSANAKARSSDDTNLGTVPGASVDAPFFTGGWLGWISYDLGRMLEPKARHDGARCAASDRDWPLMEWQRCDEALVHDRASGRWWSVGDGAAWERLVAELVDRAAASRHASDGAAFAIDRIESRRTAPPPASRTRPPPPLEAGEEQRGAGEEQRARYLAACERVLEYIRAGDVYQVNLAHRLSTPFAGSTRDLFRRLVAAAAPWYGLYLESDEGEIRRAFCGVSPELFFHLDARTGRIITRPMKGTRPARAGAADELRESEKDRAELHMIVDLMRNDLGRVCEIGSVRVEREREVEEHGRQSENGKVKSENAERERAESQRAEGRGQRADQKEAGREINADETRAGRAGILQTTATVAGVLRAGMTLADVLRAMFPGGSVTGAPKVRAMQIIDELEASRRGPYCGAAGFVGDDGSAAFNIAIRTALVTGRADPRSPARDAVVDGTLDYSVGAGIVADSVSEAEWRETLEKAGVMRAIFRAIGGQV